MATCLAVPATGRETHHWTAEPDGMAGRARLAAASGHYDSAVPAQIASYAPTLPGELAADLDEASSALSELDTHVATAWPNTNALVAPMSAILLRTESASSSQIEQLTVGARQLALAEIGLATSDNANTVVGNVRAMERALTWKAPISQEAILAIHAALLSHQAGWQHQAGHYRDQLVWVGRSGLGPRDAVFVGPQPELICDAMADLIVFIERIDLPIVLQLAISHAQFETIHPFADGNGRTGRALLHTMLRNIGLVTHIAAPISAGLLTDTEGYFDALTAYRAGDGEPIVRRFADACRFAASSGRRLITDLTEQLELDRAKMTGLRPQATAWHIVPLLAAHPVVNAALLVNQLGLGDVAAQRALRQLTQAGVLEERTGLRRNRVWQHNGVLAILNDYASNLHRR